MKIHGWGGRVNTVNKPPVLGDQDTINIELNKVPAGDRFPLTRLAESQNLPQSYRLHSICYLPCYPIPELFTLPVLNIFYI